MKKILISAILLLIILQTIVFAVTDSMPAYKIKNTDITAIQSGFGYLFVLKNDHTLWAVVDDFVINSKEFTNSDKAYLLDNEVDSFSLNGNTIVFIKKNELFQWSGSIEDILTQKPTKVDDNAKLCEIGGEGLENTYFLYLKNDNTLWGWGSNLSGQLGAEKQGETIEKPIKIANDVSSFSTGLDSSIIIDKNGKLYVMGSNDFQKINSNVADEIIGKPEKLLDNIKYASVSDFISSAISTEGKLYVWGVDIAGDGKTFPTTPLFDNVSKVVSTNLGYSILKNDGSLYFLSIQALMGPKPSENADIMSILKKVSDNVKWISNKGSLNFIIHQNGVVNAWWYDNNKNEVITKSIFNQTYPKLELFEIMQYIALAMTIIVIAVIIFFFVKRKKLKN